MARRTVDPGVQAVLADVGPEAAKLDVAGWLRELRQAAEAGERLDRTRVSALEQAGARAAGDGLALPVVIDAWLTAGWVLWRDVESGRRTVEALLRALDDGAKALAAGFVHEQRAAVRRDEAARAALLDDLLGEAPVDDVLAAAERAGVDVRRERAVLVVGAVNEVVLDRLRDAGALAAPREGTVVAVLDAPAPPRGPERAGLGRPGAGVAGIRRSYREARRALQVADRLDLQGVVPYVEVLPEALLLQDRPGLEAIAATALGPLSGGRLEPELLIATLEAYFREVGNVAATARRLGVHERTAVYRLARIEALTGLRLDDADDRFRLEVAVRARGLL